MQFITYLLFRLLVFIFRLIPFRVLYVLSDGLYILLYHIFKYRYRVIEDNLVKSFSTKNKEEIEELIKGAYRNFCDILLEGFKGLGKSDAQLVPRFQVKNPEVMQPFFDQNKNVVLATAHYCNWEWGITLGLQLPHYVVVPYKPLKNKYINKYVERSRTFNNLIAIPKNNTYHYMETPMEKARSLTLIADQSPVKTREKHWVDFLGRDTAFLHGPDTFARQLNAPLLYLYISRKNRGWYEGTISVLHDNPNEAEEGELTKLYAQKLEAYILQKPENWLWTHKRWKRKRKTATQKN